MCEYRNIKNFLRLNNLKIQFHGYMSLMVLMVKKLLEYFIKKELQKVDQQEFRIGKVIKKKGDKLYVKWKGLDNSVNS